jgi:hypothetical protein
MVRDKKGTSTPLNKVAREHLSTIDFGDSVWRG